MNSLSSVPIVGNTGERVVPRSEGCKEAEVAAGFDDVGLGGTTLALQPANGEQQEGHVYQKKGQEEGNGRAKRAEDHDGSKDEPPSEEETKSVVEIIA